MQLIFKLNPFQKPIKKSGWRGRTTPCITHIFSSREPSNNSGMYIERPSERRSELVTDLEPPYFVSSSIQTHTQGLCGLENPIPCLGWKSIIDNHLPPSSPKKDIITKASILQIAMWEEYFQAGTLISWSQLQGLKPKKFTYGSLDCSCLLKSLYSGLYSQFTGKNQLVSDIEHQCINRRTILHFTNSLQRNKRTTKHPQTFMNCC